MHDLAIIGGGAAGLATAIFAAQKAGTGKGILILDGARTLGAKILVAGGGRCNVTHDAVDVADFNGSKNIVKKILAAFSAAAFFELSALRFFGATLAICAPVLAPARGDLPFLGRVLACRCFFPNLFF